MNPVATGREAIVPLAALGPRICILGPSGSGKSTLAAAIARRGERNCVHLDLLYHLPHTAWQPRPIETFAALHDAAIGGQRWVMEGNYSQVLPQRLARATGVILLDLPTHLSLWRYARRTWFETGRAGMLEGGRDRFNWEMVRHIIGPTRANRRRYAALFAEIALPKVALHSPAALARAYRAWGLARG